MTDRATDELAKSIKYPVHWKTITVLANKWKHKSGKTIHVYVCVSL